MALKITLKPHEKMIIAGAAILNGGTTANLIIENNVPILRKKDIMKEEEATSPARRIYFIVQLMYLDSEHKDKYYSRYNEFVRDFVRAAPSSLPLVTDIDQYVTGGQYYSALKAAQKVIRHEEMILSCAMPEPE